MSAKAVQISVEAKLLARIDRDPEVKKRGRSAFIKAAVIHYLEAKRRRSIDNAIRSAAAGKSDEMFEEIRDLVGSQAWPEE